MKTLISLVAICCLYVSGKGQVINMGDTIQVPEEIRTITGDGYTETTNDFTGKPLIMVFWNTHCSVGVEYLATLDALHNERHQDFNILLVTSEPAEILKNAWKGKEALKHMQFAVITDDTIWRKRFPHRIEPHLVWINVDQQVKAITGYEETTSQNLQLFIRDNQLNLPAKKEIIDPGIFFSMTPLLLNQFEKYRHSIFVYTYLGGYRQSIMSGTAVAKYDTSLSAVRIHAQNVSLYTLYKLAYQEMQFFHPGRMLVKGNQSKSETAQPLYCYDLIIKDTLLQPAYRYMQLDLDRNFHYSSRKKRVKIKVLLLKSIDEQHGSRRKNGLPEKRITEDSIEWHNWNWKYFIATEWNEKGLMPYPVIDETGRKGKWDITVPARTNDLELVNATLKQYGLMLHLGKRKMDIIELKQHQR